MSVSNCYNMLKNSGYSLEGYSQDTVIELMNTKANKDKEECEKLFTILTTIYG